MTVTDITRARAVEASRELAEHLAANPIPEQYVIDKPGVYDRIPAEWYHRDPVVGGSLSASGMRKIIEPGGPARYRYKQDHPGESRSDALDFGRAVHQVVLGDFENHIAVVDADSWRTKVAQQAADEARSAGLTPILTRDWVKIAAMAQAIQDNPTAAKLLHPSTGKAEQTMVWQDKQTGVWCRSRVDWLRNVVRGRRLLLVDYKSTGRTADAQQFGRSVVDYGYAIQAWVYSEGARVLGLDADPAFLFVTQEKEAPYLVNVLQLPDEALNIGRELAGYAMRTYAECTRTGVWPGYSGEVDLIDIPAWWLKQHDEDPRFINTEPEEVSA